MAAPMLRWCPPSLSPRPGTAGAQLSAGVGACLSPHRWWQALDCDCPWPGWAAHPDESGPWKWLKPCQPCRAALAVSGCVQVSPPAPSPHGEAQGGPCRDAEYYISSQSLQGKGRRGVTVRPQDPTTRSPCHLESPASLQPLRQESLLLRVGVFTRSQLSPARHRWGWRLLASLC